MPLCLQAAAASAQVDFGLRGGLHLNQMDVNAESLSKSNRMGFFIGPTLLIETPVIGLGVDVSVLYAQHTLKLEGKEIPTKSLLVPAHARMGFGILDALSVYVLAGPHFSFVIGDEMSQWQNADGETLQFVQESTKIAFDFGIGLRIHDFEGNIIYNLPLGKTGNFNRNTVSTLTQPTALNYATSTSSSWRLSVAYYF